MTNAKYTQVWWIFEQNKKQAIGYYVVIYKTNDICLDYKLVPEKAFTSENKYVICYKSKITSIKWNYWHKVGIIPFLVD